ncbi:hypothetical protein LMG7974_01089 [Campylobacter majalis]|uniref:Peptidase S6 domain-containing protein n=1 Tax=Campylobacter majalis TaxID=2790656 RepID=A0ABM8Q729_9BACT|nr:S6 family peptidase [Campylobacter majalis]CAD7288617.1 hypothetical protein LMG7974_01089 [Campylobacter majalis]
MQKNRKIMLSIALASVLTTCAFSQNMNVNNFYYRDYLDLGQNKGVFSNTNKEIILKAKDKSEFKFVKIPNQSSRTIDGSITSLGRNYVVTANHIQRVFGANSFNVSGGNATTFSQTNYKFLTGQHGSTDTTKHYSTDTMYLKTTKYIVEGQIAPADITTLDITKNINQSNSQQNIQKISQYLKSIDDDNDARIVLYQAGTGVLKLNNSTELTNASGNTSRGGSIFLLSTNDYMMNFKTRMSHVQNFKQGIVLSARLDETFQNNTTTGDSGSGFYAYDTKKQEWVLIAVLTGHSNDARWIDLSLVSKQDFDDYKKNYEVKIDTNNELLKDKDNIIYGDKTFSIDSKKDLGYGGIVVESGTTTINGNESLKFAGFDIAKNASVNLNTKIEEDLHKIGEGSLNVNTQTGTNLRLGDGLVILNTDNAFNKIYITSGRATLKLSESITNFNTENMFFGNGGGKLDLNGKSITAKNISANDAGANIINSSTATANLTLQGNDNADTIVHTTIGGSDKNKINIAVQNTNDKTLVFNADTQIDGTLSVTNSKVAIHGHPTTHAVKTSNTSTQTIKQYDKNIPAHMDLERPSTLTQPDWDKVKFQAKQGITLENSTLSIGKDSEFNSDITANGTSAVNFGGDIDYFIDKLDGSNTQKSGSNDLLYKQEIESKKLSEQEQGNDSIKYTGTITASDQTKINSSITEFSPTLTLSNTATLIAKNLTISDNNSVNFKDNSNAKIENLILKNITDATNKIQKENTATLKITKSLTLDNAKGINLNNSQIGNLNELNLVAKNASSVMQNSATTLKGLSLNNSTYEQQGNDALSINGGNIELTNNSSLIAQNLSLENFKDENLKIDSSKFDVKNLQTDNSKLDLTKITSSQTLQSITAKNNSEITLKTWADDKIDKIKTQNNSRINFKELSFDMSSEKSMNANVGILNSVSLNNVGTIENDTLQINTLKFDDLSFGDMLKINVHFADAIKSSLDKIDYEKDYEIVTANKISGKIPYIKLSDGIFATSKLIDNKLSLQFTKEDPKSESALKNLTDNQNNELLKAIISHANSGANPTLAAQIEQAAYTKDAKVMKEILHKTETELKNIGENSKPSIINNVLFSSNLTMNSHLAHAKFNTRLTMQNAFKYPLASSGNDDIKKVFEAIEADKTKNSFWYNFGGGYFSENSGADLKFYNTNFGYDKTIDVGQASMIYGVMAGFTNAKYDAKNYKDRSKAYNIGIYADYEGANAHEFSTNLSLAYIKSEKHFSLLNNNEKAKNNGFGTLLLTQYKHRFEISDKQSIKPLVLTEFDYTKMDGFKSQNYKQDKLKEFGVNIGLGVEYAFVNEAQAHTIQTLIKKQIHRSNDNIRLNLSHANNYLEYENKTSRVKYELNYIGETRVSESFILQYNLGTSADFKGSYGGKAGIKLEYKF